MKYEIVSLRTILNLFVQHLTSNLVVGIIERDILILLILLSITIEKTFIEISAKRLIPDS